MKKHENIKVKVKVFESITEDDFDLCSDIHELFLKKKTKNSQALFATLLQLTRLSKCFQDDGVTLTSFLELCCKFIEINQDLFIKNGSDEKS